MRKCVLVIGLFLMAVSLAGCIGAPQYPISYVLQNSKTLANKPVRVRGVVSESRVLNEGPLSNMKGEYDLTDDSGTIHVKTPSSPPPSGGARTVNGTVNATGDNPILIEKTMILLYVALGVLVALAIVLVYLMVRPAKVHGYPCPNCKTRNAEDSSSCVKCGYPLKEVLRPCPKCFTANTPDAKFCEKCGEPLTGKIIPPNGQLCIYCRTSNDGIAEKCRKCGESIGGTMVAIADLTIADGSGAEDGNSYALKETLTHSIGRGERNLICLTNDLRVSEEHARVRWADGGFIIQDAASTNGTMVNGERITRQALAHGDEIQVGNTKLRFTLAGGNQEN